MMEKTFRPAEVEARHYARWEQAGAFAARADSSARPYTIMMPPPNVTGSLHMGHALTFT
ncbi:MAG: class I tRNA ligase family protein, partial [Dongiaceae bacterium]